MNTVLFIDFQEFASDYEVVLRLAHALVAKAINFLNLKVGGLDCFKNSLQELRVVKG